MSLYFTLLDALAAARPERTGALDVDFYEPIDRNKIAADRRYCVAEFEWLGRSWRRVRKLTGPKQFDAAFDELRYHMRRTGLPHVASA